MTIFTAVKYCCILHGRVCVMMTTFKFPQRSFGKTNPVKRSFQASWFTNRTSPDETYRGVEKVVHSLVVVAVETRLNTAK